MHPASLPFFLWLERLAGDVADHGLDSPDQDDDRVPPPGQSGVIDQDQRDQKRHKIRSLKMKYSRPVIAIAK